MRKQGRRVARAAMLLLVVASQAAAQQGVPTAAPNSATDDRAGDLKGVEDTLKVSDAERRRLEADIEAMRNDRARLNAALIDTAARSQAMDERVSAIEKRLETSTGTEQAIRSSLEARRGTIGEVLAALQRMGRKPPPAVLARPREMLEAIRTSMLLASVLPELRSETQALAADLTDLMAVRKTISLERETLAAASATLKNERTQLSALIDARQAALGDAERSLDASRARMLELGRQAADLKEVIARSEADAALKSRLETARQNEQARRDAAAPEGGTKVAMAPQRDPARLAPAVAFAEARGQLPPPVAGKTIKTFASPDSFGGTEKGVSFAARPGATVIAPSDGWIVYSGPYRNYGQLLILNAGGGYYVVLAGMERIDVVVGQFVLSGEPIAAMGDGSAKTASIAIGAAQPILYVEFRKDGAAIDPGPWWAKPELEKVRG